VSYEAVTYEVIGPVARICHNRPEARNAESKQLLGELDDAVKRASADDDIRVIIIGGKGDHFSAGHDLKEAQRSRAGFTVEERWAYEEFYYYDCALRIYDVPKPTIAQVQGACVAGAFMVANMCDLVVASEDAFFADPVAHTLAAAAVEVLVHPWVMGMRQAKDMLFTGRRITAAEGLQMGLVSRLVARGELEDATLALAEQVAKAPPFATRLLKRSLNRTWDAQGFRTSLQAHFDTHQLSHYTAEGERIKQQGLSNAIQKGKSSGE